MNEYITVDEGRICFKQEEYLAHQYSETWNELVIWTRTWPDGRQFKMDKEQGEKAAMSITSQLKTSGQ